MRRVLTFALLCLFGCQRPAESTDSSRNPTEAPSPAAPTPSAAAPASQAATPEAPRQAPVSPQTTAQALPQLADLAERLVPSVASIQVEVGGKAMRGGRQHVLQDPFDFFR